MKTCLLTLLAILVAGCHFDKLFQASNGTATRLAFATQPSNGTAGAPLSTVRVAAEDDGGQLVSTFSGDITVSLQANQSGATLSATVTAVSGVASFSGLEVDKAAQGYALIATASGTTLRHDTSTSFDVVPGPASALVFTVQPSNTTAGSVITPPVKVSAFDAFGNLAANFTGDIGVVLGNDGSLRGTKLSGGNPVAAVGGVATFSALSIPDVSITYYTLKGAFGTGAPLPPESAHFTVAP
jgi:hypothetical protein